MPDQWTTQKIFNEFYGSDRANRLTKALAASGASQELIDRVIQLESAAGATLFVGNIVSSEKFAQWERMKGIQTGNTSTTLATTPYTTLSHFALRPELYYDQIGSSKKKRAGNPGKPSYRQRQRSHARRTA